MEKHRLLIIDDATNLLLLYKEEFQEEGYEVDVVNSIPDAHILLNIKLYDLIIVGIRLERDFDHENIWSGLNLMRNEIPIIIVSGTPMHESGGKPLSLIGYIEKSSDLLPLKEKVYELVNKYDSTITVKA
ncbi:MAG: hypothetical protein WCU00_12790 [Candidatus Latescibacterota bacterium]